MTAKYMRRGERCATEGCDNPVHARELCHRHYRRMLAAEQTVNLCGCGCGGLTRYRFLGGHHTRLFSPEEQSRRGRCNDGSALRDTGEGKSYRKVGRRHEHRTVAEQMLVRPLASNEVVHHKNGNKRDNRPENLEVMTQSEHIAEHRQQMVEASRAARSKTA